MYAAVLDKLVSESLVAPLDSRWFERSNCTLIGRWHSESSKDHVEVSRNFRISRVQKRQLHSYVSQRTRQLHRASRRGAAGVVQDHTQKKTKERVWSVVFHRIDSMARTLLYQPWKRLSRCVWCKRADYPSCSYDRRLTCEISVCWYFPPFLHWWSC